MVRQVKVVGINVERQLASRCQEVCVAAGYLTTALLSSSYRPIAVVAVTVGAVL